MRLPIATQLVTRDGSLAKDALMVNALAEVKGQDNVLAFKRPGLALKMDFTPGAGQGIVCWRGTLYAVSGNVITQGPTEAPFADGAAWTNVANPSVQPTVKQLVAHSDGNLWLFSTVSSASGALYVYKSVDGVTWQAVAAPSTGMPNSTEYRVISFGGMFWAFPSNTAGPFLHSVYSSIDGITWSAVTTTAGWSARAQIAPLVFGDKMWVIGGYDGSYKDDVWYSTNGSSWTQATASGGFGGRWRLTAATDGSHLYVYGGFNGSVDKDDIWSSVDGITWTQKKAAVTGAARSNAQLLFYKNALWVIGDATSRADVWRSIDQGSTWTQKTSALGSGSVKASEVFSGSMFAVSASAGIWKATLNQSSDASYSVPLAMGEPVSMVSNSAAAATPYLFIKTADFAWVLTFGNPGTLTQVTDVDYPAATVPGAVFLDGYIFVMGQDGTIFNSDLENPTSWNSLDFIQAEIEPDFGVAITKHNDYILAFKQFSLEFFYDAANATGSPLSPLPSSAQKIGCANGDSVAGIDGGIYFLSRTTSQQPSVHWFQKGSLTPQEVATEDVQRFLAQADLTSVRSWAGRFSGHALYVLTLKSEGVTLVYDATSQHWSTFTYRTASAAKSVSALTQANGVATATCTGHGFLDGDPVTVAGATPSGYNGAVNVTVIDSSHFSYFVDPALGATASGTITATGSTESYFPFAAFTACGGKNYVQHETAADVFELSQAYTDDAGAVIDMRCRSMKFDSGTVGPKTMAGAVIVSEETTGNLLLRWSDDDYATFSPYRQIALQQRKPETRNLGRFRRRAFEFRYTGSGAPRLAGIEPEIGG